MKKIYKQPSFMVTRVVPMTFICGSKEVTSSNGQITYGGVDEGGTKDPEARRYHDVWEDEEQEGY